MKMHSREIRLPNGILMPTLGLGTWQMGESALTRKQEISALSYGIDLGMTLIDTAEMYANGGAERIVAEAIKGKRDQVFLVSKVLPGRASKKETILACEESLKRLKTDYLDLYLLHWRGHYPLEETFDAFDDLLRQGKIRAYGVSNFDLLDMREAFKINKENNLKYQALCAYKLIFDFKTDAGVLEYLDKKEFRVNKIDFEEVWENE